MLSTAPPPPWRTVRASSRRSSCSKRRRLNRPVSGSWSARWRSRRSSAAALGDVAADHRGGDDPAGGIAHRRDRQRQEHRRACSCGIRAASWGPAPHRRRRRRCRCALGWLRQREHAQPDAAEAATGCSCTGDRRRDPAVWLAERRAGADRADGSGRLAAVRRCVTLLRTSAAGSGRARPIELRPSSASDQRHRPVIRAAARSRWCCSGGPARLQHAVAGRDRLLVRMAGGYVGMPFGQVTPDHVARGAPEHRLRAIAPLDDAPVAVDRDRPRRSRSRAMVVRARARTGQWPEKLCESCTPLHGPVRSAPSVDCYPVARPRHATLECAPWRSST